MREEAKQKIKDAMENLTAIDSAIGAKGATLEEMNVSQALGEWHGGDAVYEICQRTWLLLRDALAMEDKR